MLLFSTFNIFKHLQDYIIYRGLWILHYIVYLIIYVGLNFGPRDVAKAERNESV